MKKAYTSPTLVTFGRLEELTLGAGGSSPDVASLNNDNCFTGTATNTAGATVTVGCTTGPLS